MLKSDRISRRGAFVLGLAVLGSPTAAPARVYLVQHVAGAAGGGGATDGLRATARFAAPTGVATDGKGTIWVADAGNCTIRRISADGQVRVVAGTPGGCGSADGAPGLARFAAPRGVVADGSGTLYVADTANHAIRKITPTGLTSTFAGKVGERGTADGTGAAARFDAPAGITRDASGNLYVADRDNHAIRKVTPAGAVTTLAGAAGERGSSDGSGGAARFAAPEAIALDAGGLIVADTGNHAIRRITMAGLVSTLAGQAGVVGSADGTATAARFAWPSGVAVANGLAYVADTGNDALRTVTPAGIVTTVAGLAGTPGEQDGQGLAARFRSPGGWSPMEPALCSWPTSAIAVSVPCRQRGRSRRSLVRGRRPRS